MANAVPLVAGNPNYRFGIAMDGKQYLLDIRWNGREEAWYMDIYTTDNVAVRRGIKMVLGSLLGRRCADPEFPNGVLQMIDASGTGVDATLDDIGVRVHMIFIDAQHWVYGT